LRSVSWKEVLGYLTHINLFLFILLIIVTPVHLATRAFRWKYLLMHEKKNVRFFNMFAGNAVGFTVTLIFPGRLGELVKPLYLAKKEEMPKGFVLGTVVVERIFDIFTMCFLLGAFLLARPLYSSSNNLNSEAYTNLTLWGIIGVSFASCLLVFILIFYFFREKTLAVVAFLARPFPHKISQGVQELAREFILGLKFFHSLGNLTLYILFSFVVWLGIVAYYWLFFFSYRYSLSFFLVFPFVFLTMVGASIPTPGMVGGFDYFSKLGMTSLFGISASRAVGMTIVIHAIQVVVTCLIGYVILWKDGLSVFKLKKLREAVEK
jgi:uncharacterized protein (TIRG00374 family)